METIEQTITVHAPVRKIFDYLREPSHLLTLLPGVIAIDDVDQLGNGGWKFRWERTLCGVRFEGIGICTELAPFHSIGYTLSGGLSNDLCWTLTPVADGTSIDMTMTYEIPRPLERKHSEYSITHKCDENAAAILKNLAAVFEQHGEEGTSSNREIPPPVTITG